MVGEALHIVQRNDGKPMDTLRAEILPLRRLAAIH